MKKHKLLFIALFAISQLAFAAGTATTVLHGSTTGNGTYSKVVLTTDVSGLLPLTNIATQATNTITGNATSGTASPTALAIPSCSGATNALKWTTNTGFGCNTISAGGAPGGSSGDIQYNNAGAFGGITPTGTGAVVKATVPTINQANLVGTTTNDNAAAGSVGELIEASVDNTSPVSLTSGSNVVIASVSLTPGDWDCSGTAAILPGSGTSVTYFYASMTTGTIVVTTAFFTGALNNASSGVVYPTAYPQRVTLPVYRYSVASTTTINLVFVAGFSVSTLVSYGDMRCRRMR